MMKTISEDDFLTCIYCLESQGHPAIDYILFTPNFSGTTKPTYNTSVQEERCIDCDSIMYLRLNDDQTISIANSPSL